MHDAVLFINLGGLRLGNAVLFAQYCYSIGSKQFFKDHYEIGNG